MDTRWRCCIHIWTLLKTVDFVDTFMLRDDRLVARRGTSTGTEKMNTELRMYSVYSMYIMYSTYLSMYTRSHTARNTSSLHTSW